MRKILTSVILALMCATIPGHAVNACGNKIDFSEAIFNSHMYYDQGDGTAISLWGEVTTNLSIHPFVHDARIIEVDIVTNSDEQEGLRVVLFDKDTMIQKTMEKDPTMKLQLMCTALDGMHIQNHKAEMGEEFLGVCQLDGYCVGYNARIVPMGTKLPTGQKKISSSDYPKLKFFKYDLCEISAVIKFENLTEAPGISQVLAPVVENRKETDHARYALVYAKDTMYTAFTEKMQDDRAILRALPLSHAEIKSYEMLAAKATSKDERRTANKLADYMECLRTGMLPGEDPKNRKPRYRIFSWDVKKAVAVAPAPDVDQSIKVRAPLQSVQDANVQDVPPSSSDTVRIEVVKPADVNVNAQKPASTTVTPSNPSGDNGATSTPAATKPSTTKPADGKKPAPKGRPH